MSIIVNRHITFIDLFQFYNSSLDTLASDLNDEDFKYLVSKFGTDKLKILKKKMYILMNGWIHMKNLNTLKHIYKIFGIHLILILSKIFMIII